MRRTNFIELLSELLPSWIDIPIIEVETYLLKYELKFEAGDAKRIAYQISKGKKIRKLPPYIDLKHSILLTNILNSAATSINERSTEKKLKVRKQTVFNEGSEIRVSKELKNATKTALERAGITTFYHLATLTEEDILKINGIGIGSLKDVEKLLERKFG
ncbi:DNA-directed RNA polymerase subunit alpha C-terminal domain-containing protein [Calidifontibacillus oryziterrae]|uniref:DNA-directed RNA polymerase subunit alpha C-terminal domain-containing protein n=1 Tax=Calidifontibacillus oryziterrae TaxID=1191699 RepID=UPI000309DFA2|nr:DNA-directed RNA polymerase subunit alpha C-terminal domain-containing protein [Calidifontibacillus oryziterrae]